MRAVLHPIKIHLVLTWVSHGNVKYCQSSFFIDFVVIECTECLELTLTGHFYCELGYLCNWLDVDRAFYIVRMGTCTKLKQGIFIPLDDENNECCNWIFTGNVACFSIGHFFKSNQWLLWNYRRLLPSDHHFIILT